MRGIAVVAVLLFHLHNGLLEGGFVGVDVFFVISGYLISSIILVDCQHDKFSLSRFYQRRVSRIFPVFFLVCSSILVAASLLYIPRDFASAGASATAASLSIANIKFMLQGNYFKISLDAQPFLHYWSLSVEEQFYVFLPLTLFFAQKLRLSKLRLLIVLGTLALVSFFSCLVLTALKPTWAFYLMPARAWELLAGSMLAIGASRESNIQNRKLKEAISIIGLLCIIASILFIREESFPGYIAALPVIGTVLLIGRSYYPQQLTERLLSNPILTFIGKASYSIYLWHWPVYCFIDYSLYFRSTAIRTGLKIILTIALSVSSYLCFEKPVRTYLNHPARKIFNFAGFAIGALVFIIAGTFIRSANYIDASPAKVADGGITFNSSVKDPVVVLMGDSNGSMYGKAMKDIAAVNNVRVHVISVAAGDPFPSTDLYRNSIQFLSREKPTITIFVAAWAQKIGSDPEKLSAALSEILRYSQHVILISQPPILPENASREAIRREGMHPVYEDIKESSMRKSTNEFLFSLRNERVHVLDIESLFIQSDGQIRLTDNSNRQLFQDSGHLSDFGTELVSKRIASEISAILELRQNVTAKPPN